jgi:hypothetical protein
MNINGFPTRSTFDDINTQNVKALDNTANITLQDSTIDLLANNVLVNGISIVSGVINPLNSNLNIGSFDVVGVGIGSIDSLNNISNKTQNQTAVATLTEFVGGVSTDNLFLNGTNGNNAFVEGSIDFNGAINLNSDIGFFGSPFFTLPDGGWAGDFVPKSNGIGNMGTVAKPFLSLNVSGVSNSNSLNTSGGNTLHKLATNNSFAITDNTAGQLQLLKFNISNNTILSQILHTFSTGLEPVTNLGTSVGSTLKRFLNGYIQNLFTNNITPSNQGLTVNGKLYIGLRPVVSGGWTMYVPVTISNTTVKTVAITPGLGTLVIGGGTLLVGSTSTARLSGIVSAANNATITLSLNITDSNNNVSTIELNNQFPNSVTASSWTLETMYVVTSIVGNVCTVNYNTAFRYSILGSSMGGTLQTDSFTVNSNLSLTSSFSVQWGGSPTTANVWRTTQGHNMNVFQPVN